MSRTYRRSSCVPGFKPRTQNGVRKIQQHLKDHVVSYNGVLLDWLLPWEQKQGRDGKTGRGSLPYLVKSAAKVKVRARSRMEIRRLMKDPDHDTRPHEWETRGEIWNWD